MPRLCRPHQIYPTNTMDNWVKEIKNRIAVRADISDHVRQRLISALAQLCQFDLGRFLIFNRGLNGYWTDYIVKYPENQQEYAIANETERFILENAHENPPIPEPIQ